MIQNSVSANQKYLLHNIRRTTLSNNPKTALMERLKRDLMKTWQVAALQSLRELERKRNTKGFLQREKENWKKKR